MPATQGEEKRVRRAKRRASSQVVKGYRQSCKWNMALSTWLNRSEMLSKYPANSELLEINPHWSAYVNSFLPEFEQLFLYIFQI